MRNLLTETLDRLEAHSRTPSDVKWVGSESFGYFTWEEFCTLADFAYDAGFGCAEVAEDLLVVGDGWWLERAEYDGSEWWAFKTTPTKPELHRIPTRLAGGMWDDLKELNSDPTPEQV